MKKILVVEDEVPLIQILVQRLKTSSNFTILTAADGQEALAIIRKENPDLVVLDIVMPKLSGLQVLEELRFKDHNEVNVIVLSNLDKPTDQDIIKKFKISEYIIKSSVSLTKLMQIINGLASTSTAPAV